MPKSTTDAAKKKAIKDAMGDAGTIMRRWFKAAKDGGTKQITRNERLQLKREIALGLLKWGGFDEITTADLP